ncbi:MAG: NAD-dependent epimerase/dehydratase family protein [Acidobacteria bacterium]|nr:NAD-dependent epimerase/dehydratase family protein [Acidobacteriota bacterium]
MVQAEMEGKTALVTGATGFIGGNLVPALLRKGYSVTCLVRGSSDTRMLQKLPVQLVAGNLDDPESIRKAAVGARVVFHIAGLTKAPNRQRFFLVNRTGTSRLLETLSEINPKPARFVHASSLAAAGPSDPNRPLVEEDDPNPVSWYGESKLAAEEAVLKYADVFPVTILRPPAVYGPGDRDIYLIFRMIQRGCLFTPGRTTRRFSLIHVHDLVDAFIKAGESKITSGEVFFVSRPEIHTWEEVGREIARELNIKYRRISFPEWLALAAGAAGNFYSLLSGKASALSMQKVRELLQPSWTCDPSKAQAVLDFNPAIELSNGIRNTIQWYRLQGWL